MTGALTIVPDDRAFVTNATVEGVTLTQHDIRSHELTRARRALAYLKTKLGDEAMRRLLAEDIATMTTIVRGWVRSGTGTRASWRSAGRRRCAPGIRSIF